MNPFTQLVLPQNDTPEGRKQRAEQLASAQAQYVYDYPEIVAGLPMAKTPIPVDMSLLWLARVAEVGIALGENLVDLVLPNVVDFDVQVPVQLGKDATGASLALSQHPPRPVQALDAEIQRAITELGVAKPEIAAEALRFKNDMREARKSFAALSAAAMATTADPPPFLPPDGSVAAFVGKHVLAPAEDAVATRAASWLDDLLKRIAEFLGTLVGVYGRAEDLSDYDDQFRKIPLPWTAGVFQTDEVFAQMRVAGPNPVVLRRATAADLEGFALDDARLGSLLGEQGASVERALAVGALYIVDYGVLTSLEPGTNPQQKYVFAPRALFAVPATGKRALRPLAIQTTQEKRGPVYYPGDGTNWEIAKILVNMADGNYHELISHLGLTHLLTEPFVLSTLRQLDPAHPVHVLLAPHFAGTLTINYAAQTSLITNGNAVDLLTAGTIESARALAATAVKNVRYNASFFPDTLVDRGVDDARALPDYPYRDDALSLWNAIHAWVSEYVGIYYRSDGDVAGDYELQAWVQELVTAGKIQDIGEGAPGEAAQIKTAAYLSKLLTQVIFTASVQHATVNFAQRTMMGFTPAMPLAAYAQFPAPEGAPATEVLDILPPLQQALLQQAMLTGLGGVYYTALGQYGGELALPQVGGALKRFQERLLGIEKAIQAANALGQRTPYTTLLPTVIPQSINI
jgi:arachidonate 15-lipoxygenase